MKDDTEQIRRAMIAAQRAAGPSDRAALEQEHGEVWDTAEMSALFEVIGFMAPYCVVRRKADGVKGSLLFQHYPRFYWRFQEHIQ